MATQLTKYFGEINLDELEEWYDTELELNGKKVEVSITVSTASKSLDKDDIQKIDDYIENLQSNEENIRFFIQEDFKRKGETKDYIDNQIEEQDKEDITYLIRDADKKLSKEEKLLSALILLRIVFYPEKEDNMFAVFDYTINEELTDDLLAVKLYKNDSIRIDIES
ncbi:MAG: DUF2004 domain-containing protein [Dysgonomonas sp.]|nr:DUF2004 domain-containing protein [Dysgonomonas sp.]